MNFHLKTNREMSAMKKYHRLNRKINHKINILIAILLLALGEKLIAKGSVLQFLGAWFR